ncbi:looped-hinge helix DNA binding domain, AbrB family [Butyrivibrio fibrisolvens 16/4]|nr:looped-hinge helix DNA binding domain, AbrB family [Butyrivibrio fibrisolvens 16/4]
MSGIVAEVTSVSTKGQVVLPKSIRDALAIRPGAKLIVMSDGDNILIKPIKTPTLSEFSDLMDKAQAWAESVGLQEEDINDAIKAVRQKRRTN